MSLIISIRIVTFLCIYITGSYSVSHTFAPGEKIRSKLKWNLTTCVLWVKVNQLRVKNTHIKMGTASFHTSMYPIHFLSFTHLVQCVSLVSIWHDDTMVLSSHVTLDSLAILTSSLMNIDTSLVRTDKGNGSDFWVVTDEVHSCKNQK